jgi:hypothetical protein
LSPVVDLLNKEKKGLLSHEVVQQEIERLKGIDSRDQFKRYMYQPLENRQYSLSMSGGAPSFRGPLHSATMTIPETWARTTSG